MVECTIQIHLGLIFFLERLISYIFFLLTISQGYSLALIESLKCIYVAGFLGGREHSRFNNHKNWVKRFMRSLRKTLFQVLLTTSFVFFSYGTYQLLLFITLTAFILKVKNIIPYTTELHVQQYIETNSWCSS